MPLLETFLYNFFASKFFIVYYFQMLNTNYSYVNPLINQHTDNLAKGVPHQTINRNFSQPIEQNRNLSPYNRENSEIAKKKLYSPKLSPSNLSTESYLKSRSNNGPCMFTMRQKQDTISYLQ